MDKTQLGAFVAENRKALGLTQRELADRLHVTDKAVSKWERGLSYPDVTLLEPLADVLGLDVAALISGGDGQPRESAAQLLEITAQSLAATRRRMALYAVVLVATLAGLLALAIYALRFPADPPVQPRDYVAIERRDDGITHWPARSEYDRSGSYVTYEEVPITEAPQRPWYYCMQMSADPETLVRTLREQFPLTCLSWRDEEADEESRAWKAARVAEIKERWLMRLTVCPAGSVTDAAYGPEELAAWEQSSGQEITGQRTVKVPTAARYRVYVTDSAIYLERPEDWLLILQSPEAAEALQSQLVLLWSSGAAGGGTAPVGYTVPADAQLEELPWV